jgi:hypothetical protein
MHFGTFPAPSVAIFAVILGLSFAVARLDFVRRNGKKRPPVRRIPAVAKKTACVPAVEPAAGVIETPIAKTSAAEEAVVLAPVVEKPKPVAAAASPAKPLDRMAWMPATNRKISTSLGFGSTLPIPMPAPKLPKNSSWRGTTVTWWPQES